MSNLQSYPRFDVIEGDWTPCIDSAFVDIGYVLDAVAEHDLVGQDHTEDEYQRSAIDQSAVDDCWFRVVVNRSTYYVLRVGDNYVLRGCRRHLLR